MKEKKKIVLLVTIFFIIMMLANSVYATDSYKAYMESNKTTLKHGEEIQLKVILDEINIETGEGGIGSYSGDIVYDTAIFENLKMSISNESVWEEPTLNKGSFVSVIKGGNLVSEKQEVAIISLTVKADAKNGDYKIKLTNFKASNGVNTILTEDSEISVKVEEGIVSVDGNSTNTNTVTENNNTEGDVSGTENNVNENSKSDSITNNTKGTSKNTLISSILPNTGKGIVIVLILVAIIAIFSVKQYKKYKSI